MLKEDGLSRVLALLPKSAGTHPDVVVYATRLALIMKKKGLLSYEENVLVQSIVEDSPANTLQL